MKKTMKTVVLLGIVMLACHTLYAQFGIEEQLRRDRMERRLSDRFEQADQERNQRAIEQQKQFQKQQQLQQQEKAKQQALRQAKEKEKQLQEQRKRQDRRVEQAAKNWDKTTASTLSAYIDFVRTDIKKPILDEVYLTSVITCADEIGKENGKTENALEFSRRISAYWKNKSESKGTIKTKEEAVKYCTFAESISRKIESKNNTTGFKIEAASIPNGKNNAQVTSSPVEKSASK